MIAIISSKLTEEGWFRKASKIRRKKSDDTSEKQIKDILKDRQRQVYLLTEAN